MRFCIVLTSALSLSGYSAHAGSKIDYWECLSMAQSIHTTEAAFGTIGTRLLDGIEGKTGRAAPAREANQAVKKAIAKLIIEVGDICAEIRPSNSP